MLHCTFIGFEHGNLALFVPGLHFCNVVYTQIFVISECTVLVARIICVYQRFQPIDESMNRRQMVVKMSAMHWNCAQCEAMPRSSDKCGSTWHNAGRTCMVCDMAHVTCAARACGL
eukprot:GHUV01018242.1.p1 GENE.GHUV01018242.1~~GHUV01018242.1.p1  ORF type:complete len:116 (+),score=11.04 GHUV01018242.1:202-549(+)